MTELPPPRSPRPDPPIAPLRRAHGVVTRDGAALHVVEYGPADAEVTVVLAHGWTLTHAAWSAAARALTGSGSQEDGRVRVVAYDQRAHGRSSSGLVRPFSIDQLGEDLLDVIEATAPDGPVVLGGHSMGGMTVMALAAAHPRLFGPRVTGVLLVGTSSGELVAQAPPFPLHERLRGHAGLRFFALGQRHPELFARGRRLLPGPHTRAHVRAVRKGLFGPGADENVVRACAWMMHRTSVEALCGFFPAIAAHDKAGTLAALSTVPVHIVVGAHDKLTPPRHARRLAAELPHAEMRLEPDCGHMVVTERPDAVTAPLRALCRSAARSTT